MVAVLSTNGAQVQAKEKKKNFVIPCGHPAWRVLDFWVGEWQVFHTKTDKIAGYDRVIRTLKGCSIQQNWVSFDDHFSSPYVPFRMSGKSLTAFNGREWIQFWVDNQAGSQILRGKFENKIFTFYGDRLIGGHQYRLKIFKEGKIVRVINERQYKGKEGKSETSDDASEKSLKGWQVLFDFTYKRNRNQLLLPNELKTTEDVAKRVKK